MIELLLQFLRNTIGFKIPYVFSYTSTRMMLAALTTLLLSIFLGPKFIRTLYALKIGQSIRTVECPPLAELHAKKKDTPTMGGLLILFSILAAMFLWMDLTHIFTLLLFLTVVILGMIGGLDDYLKLRYKNAKGLSGRRKLIGQLAVSSVVAVYLFFPSISEGLHLGDWYKPPVVKEERQGVVPLQNFASRVYIPFIKEPVAQFSGAFLILPFLLTLVVITGSSNAVNLTDGLDGLAAGCLMMVAFCLSIVAFLSNNLELSSYLNILYIEGSGEIAIFLCALMGACLGFLWYNGHPAQVFMGDIGSLALGGAIGVSSVLLKKEFLLALIGGIFVAEALSVIIQVASYRLRNKKRVFLCAPLHHHFEYKGWPETKVVLRFWIVALILAIIGMASLKFQ